MAKVNHLPFQGYPPKKLKNQGKGTLGKVRHYLDNTNLETDAIVELPNGSWSAFEIKLSPDKIDAAANSLNRLEAKMVKAEQPVPQCKCVIVGTFQLAYQRPDGVNVVPLAALQA